MRFNWLDYDTYPTWLLCALLVLCFLVALGTVLAFALAWLVSAWWLVAWAAGCCVLGAFYFFDKVAG